VTLLKRDFDRAQWILEHWEVWDVIDGEDKSGKSRPGLTAVDLIPEDEAESLLTWQAAGENAEVFIYLETQVAWSEVVRIYALRVAANWRPKKK
jgi:hypothetical protein